MKNPLIITLLLFVGVALATYFLVSRNTNNSEVAPVISQPEESMNQESVVLDNGTYTIDSKESSIVWTAEKPLIIGYTHRGTFALRDGALTVDDGSIRGMFTLDMTALKVTSLGGGKAGNESRLETHLKSGDFFNVDTYPTATFEITNSSRAGTQDTFQIVGNLTLKEITEEISFTANVRWEDGSLHFDANTEIDRTKWNIVFGSSNFFDNLADNAISDTVGLSIALVAKK